MQINVVRIKQKTRIPARCLLIVTELVSRVLYVFLRNDHLSSPIITDRFKPCGSATMKWASSPSGKPEDQGVASDRVYSGSMLP